ncbi:2,4-dichlorophenol 6-monooxygenase [Variovorax sp. PBS-H4]|uniref:FAD-dependent monooxygenase n=1 Tax=Variovorax sp. PBS-H4 TaxID=434008 RepID=UPI0013183BE2|nr:FAD-dependent monooxygenase [Variovorax sp. PBS-H4]VTU28381.1 2,4-dichlorophenol 6-monooxygenase [Variovorax sp. PBS-H4]
MTSSPSSSTQDTQVFIVGGGPVGLAMAVLLDRFEVPFVVVERNPSTTNHPKSRGCWPRTMELFRQWGVEDKIRARGLNDGTDIFAFVESMAGREIGRTTPEPSAAAFTPARKSLVAQDAVEEELYALARESRHGQVLFSTECLGFEDLGGGVAVTTRNVSTGEERRWQASYLIAADGAGSSVRRKLGIEFDGPSTLAVMANDYWRADLSRLRVAREAAMFRVLPKQEGVPVATILNTNGRDRWLTLTQIGLTQDERDHVPTDDEVIAMVRAHAGIRDLEVEILNRSTWRVSRQVAKEFRRGRVFLAGDAVHRFPPTGGFGLNSGVQDAHNLAWKLAYVLKGLAGDHLLDSYEAERRPVAESNANFSFANRERYQLVEDAIRSGNEDRIAFWIGDSDNHLHSIGQSLGFSYASDAVVPDGTAAKPLNPRFYDPSDRPGSRFPHMWLDAARQHSTLDWFDREFVLVAGPLGHAWNEVAARAAAAAGVAVHFRQLPLAIPSQGFQMGMRGAALVRPDGHVCYRAAWLPQDAATEVTAALGKVLAPAARS